MTFRCPACKKRKPIERGLLVMEQQPHRKQGRGRLRNQNPPIVAVLCGPCTGRILVERAQA